jgi:hypothetical protein
MNATLNKRIQCTNFIDVHDDDFAWQKHVVQISKCDITVSKNDTTI